MAAKTVTRSIKKKQNNNNKKQSCTFVEQVMLSGAHYHYPKAEIMFVIIVCKAIKFSSLVAQ